MAGLAAAALADRGESVTVTAPTRAGVEPLFERARVLLRDLGRAVPEEADVIDLAGGGQIRYLQPARAVEAVQPSSIVIADEAAGIAVPILEQLLAADRLVCSTTVHGYEGTGRGFAIRFRDRLEASDHTVTDVTLTEPIRYSGGDPLEIWAFHALLLDAAPAVTPVVESGSVETVTYEVLTPTELIANEPRLREVMGLLTEAHYRTEPNDLARLLDAPNLTVRALLHGGHVVSVALLAREGGLSADLRGAIYEGDRVQGHMIPDMLTSYGRDEDAGRPTGIRIVRIATHEAVRSRGLGTHLLEQIATEFEGAVDWLGAGFGATPDLVHFWDQAGYGTISVSMNRNDRSGVHSAIMLRPMSSAGRQLRDRHARWLRRRLPAACTDSLATIHPPTLQAIIPTIPGEPAVSLEPNEWAIVIAAAFGPGLLAVDPEPARRLLLAYLSLSDDERRLDQADERLLIRRVLFGEACADLASTLGYPSTRECWRAVGRSLQPIVERFVPDELTAEIARFE
ncbi:MAG: GNAT family N-acetyltransferase [Natrialbaceae archaeon]|nr:GNAT family N-acetyltransferase [Natrialbaceae archaeon]